MIQWFNCTSLNKFCFIANLCSIIPYLSFHQLLGCRYSYSVQDEHFKSGLWIFAASAILNTYSSKVGLYLRTTRYLVFLWMNAMLTSVPDVPWLVKWEGLASETNYQSLGNNKSLPLLPLFCNSKWINSSPFKISIFCCLFTQKKPFLKIEVGIHPKTINIK